MARIRLNLRNLSVTDKIAKGRQIVAAMTNNANFTTPNPRLAEVTGTIDDLEKANAAVQAARSEVATRVLAQDATEARMDRIGWDYMRETQKGSLLQD